MDDNYLYRQNVKTLAAMETSRRKASQMLRSSFMSNGERRLEYSEVMVARRNNNSRPIFLNYEPENFVEPTGDTVFGEEVMIIVIIRQNYTFVLQLNFIQISDVQN